MRGIASVAVNSVESATRIVCNDTARTDRDTIALHATTPIWMGWDGMGWDGERQR